MNLRGIDIEVHRGEIVCLIGSNGAGKSTTLMTISGILRPSAGEVLFEGASIGKVSPHEIVGRGICQVPEGRRIFPRLTVYENLEMGCFGRGGANLKRNLERVFGPLYAGLCRRTKEGWDPAGILNPGVVVSAPGARPLDLPLKVGVAAPAIPEAVAAQLRRIEREAAWSTYLLGLAG